MDSNTIYLIINALLYVITFVVYQFKRKKFTVISALLLFYGISAVVAVHLFDNPFNTRKYNDITLFPLVYLYLMLMLAFSPLFKVDKIQYRDIEAPGSIAYNVFCGVVIIIMLSTLGYTFRNFGTTLNSMILSDDAGADIYSDTAFIVSSTGYGVSNIQAVLKSLVGDFPIFLLMYHLTRKKRNHFITVGLVLSVLVAPMSSINIASRGALVNSLISLFVWFVVMQHWMSKKIKRYFIIISSAVVSIFIFAFILITNSRFGQYGVDNQYALYSLESYYGQPFLNFDNYGLDAGGIRYGDRTATGVKALFVGMDDVPKNYVERTLKYSNLRINETSFYTFVGDFTIDYGPVIATLMFVVFAIGFRMQFPSGVSILPFHKLIPLYFIVCVLAKGLPLFPYSDVFGNIQMLMFVLIYVYFKVDYNLRKNQ